MAIVWVLLTGMTMTWLPAASRAQEQARTLSGQIDYPELGVRFTIPPDWIGQETQGGLILGSNTEVGIILVLPNAYETIEQIRQSTGGHIIDEGVSLGSDGSFVTHSESVVGAPFKGLFQGQAARAWAVASHNPNGAGLSVLAITSTEAWTDSLRDRAVSLATSIEYFEPDNATEIAEWKTFLSDVRLTDMSSSYSGGASVDGYSTYSGSSSETRLHLCAAGHYKYGHQSSFSVDSGGGFANGGNDNQDAGNWEVVSGAQGQAVLALNSHDGERFEFSLSHEEGKTFLDGTRYFRTLPNDSNGYGPDCP